MSPLGTLRRCRFMFRSRARSVLFLVRVSSSVPRPVRRSCTSCTGVWSSWWFWLALYQLGWRSKDWECALWRNASLYQVSPLGFWCSKGLLPFLSRLWLTMCQVNHRSSFSGWYRYSPCQVNRRRSSFPGWYSPCQFNYRWSSFPGWYSPCQFNYLRSSFLGW